MDIEERGGMFSAMAVDVLLYPESPTNGKQEKHWN